MSKPRIELIKESPVEGAVIDRSDHAVWAFLIEGDPYITVGVAPS